MKQTFKNTAGNISLISVAMLLFVLLPVMAVSAQGMDEYSVSRTDEKSASEFLGNKYALKNLTAGIKSEYSGIKRDCIYYAGKYQVSEVLFPLMEQLRNEKDPEIRVLIALSLHKIGDARGLYLVKEFSTKDHNSRVRRMCTAIYNDYLINRNARLAGE